MEDATVVPQKSLIQEKGASYIYVMRRDSTVERRYIEVSAEFGNNMVVERGIIPGEMVVTEGVNKLTPGIKVTVARPEDFVNTDDTEAKAE